MGANPGTTVMPTIDPTLRRLLREDPVSPLWDPVRESLLLDPIAHSWQTVVTLLELADVDDIDWLCSFGINVLEPLIQSRWREILPGIQAEALSHQLRRALSCAWISGLPEPAQAALDELMPESGSLDDIASAT